MAPAACRNGISISGNYARHQHLPRVNSLSALLALMAYSPLIKKVIGGNHHATKKRNYRFSFQHLSISASSEHAAAGSMRQWKQWKQWEQKYQHNFSNVK